MNNLEILLSGGSLRSLGKSNSIISKIRNQNDFTELFKFLFHDNRIVAMRAADVIEKVTITNPEYLSKHKKEIIALCKSVTEKEVKWHLALLLPRLPINNKELLNFWETLTMWATDKNNSRIVRVHSIQSLFELLKQRTELKKDFDLTLMKLERENIPSLNARIKKVRKEISKI
ncbi:MAG: hypothetical protein ABI772_08745 [Bacteroidota bacterium]